MAAVIADVIAALALVMSAIALGQNWWGKRSAGLEARFERHHGQTGREFRLVLQNHGPAAATHVKVRLLHSDRSEETFWVQLWGDIGSIPVLHPGQQYHLPVLSTGRGSDPRIAKVTWQDRRRGQQTLDIWLSRQDLL